MKWFTKYWATIGGFIAVVIILYILVSDLRIPDIESLLWLHFAILLIHQFEEYVYPGGFKEFFQENIYNKNRIIRFPLNDEGIILVNVVLGWTAYLTSAIYGEKMLWLAIGLLGVTILNGFLHTLMFVINRKYNPGFVSGLFLCIPFGIYVLLGLVNDLPTKTMISGIIIFIIGFTLIPLSIFVTNKFKVSNKE